MFAAVGERAGQHGDLADGAGQAEQAEHLAEGRLVLDVAQPLDRMALKIMRDLVTDDGGQLGFVFYAQQQAGPYLDHAVGRHAGVEQWRAHQEHTDVGTMLGAEATGDALDIGLEFFVA